MKSLNNAVPRDSDTVLFKERHMVPAHVVQIGLAKFNLMLEMNAPGTVPDPLLIAALIDLVIPFSFFQSRGVCN